MTNRLSGRRPDLSPYIVHLTRDYTADALAPENLVSILCSRCIEARNPYGIAVRHLELIGCTSDEFRRSQRVACFSETPPESLAGLLSPGVWRRYEFRPYGVAFHRQVLLDRGANPVWYLNGFRGDGFRWRSHDVNTLIDKAAKNSSGTPTPEIFARSEIARLTPFIEVMGSWPTGAGNSLRAKDFTFEREWRHQGDFRFAHADIATVLVPPGKDTAIRELLSDAGLREEEIKSLKWTAIAS